MTIIMEIYPGKKLFSAEFAHNFFDILEKYQLVPDKIGLYEPLRTPYTKEKAIEIHLDLEGNENSPGGGMMGKIKKPNITFMTYWHHNKSIIFGNKILLWITKGGFMKNELKLVNLFKELVDLTDANYGYIADRERKKQSTCNRKFKR